MSIRKLLRVRSVAALSAVAALVLRLAACVGGATEAPTAAGTTTLHLVGYAVPKEANNAIQKKFAETPEGKGVVQGVVGPQATRAAQSSA
jgi:sulfate transport system substrate-binding protein